jgi:hypothetical protein
MGNIVKCIFKKQFEKRKMINFGEKGRKGKQKRRMKVKRYLYIKGGRGKIQAYRAWGMNTTLVGKRGYIDFINFCPKYRD